MFEKANGLWRVERTAGLPQQSWEAISLLRYNVAAASDGVEAERGSLAILDVRGDPLPAFRLDLI